MKNMIKAVVEGVDCDTLKVTISLVGKHGPFAYVETPLVGPTTYKEAMDAAERAVAITNQTGALPNLQAPVSEWEAA